MKKLNLSLSIFIFSFLLSCGGGGGGGGGGSSNTATSGSQNNTQSPKQVVANYQNQDITSQIFNTAVADLNGDGLEDVVVSGWAVEPSGYTSSPHGKVPLKILIQQNDGTLLDQTSTWLTNNLIYGSQRIIIQDFDGDGKPDIFLGGFQDSPSLPNSPVNLCCSPVTSVMLWNQGTTFSRYDFADPVWAHAVCVGNLKNTGYPSIVMGAANGFNSNIYINNGSRNFTLIHTNQWIGSGGQCSVISDSTTGNVAIISGNSGYTQVAGYDGDIKTYDSSMNYIGISGLPGTENTTGKFGIHDVVNIINMDINADGKSDLILTDNNNDNATGSFTALINQGSLSFSNRTSTYFPTQTNNYYFQYYARTLTINGSQYLYVDNVSSGWNFSTLPDLWQLSNGSFSPQLQTQMSSLISSNYIQPTLYISNSSAINLLLIQQINNSFNFFTEQLLN